MGRMSMPKMMAALIVAGILTISCNVPLLKVVSYRMNSNTLLPETAGELTVLSTKQSQSTNGLNKQDEDIHLLISQTQQHNLTSFNWPEDELGKPRIVIASGCSGSSATTSLIHQIIEAHGLSVCHYKYGLRDLELLKPEKNPFYEEARKKLKNMGHSTAYGSVMLQAVKDMQEDARLANQTVFFKADVSHLTKGGSTLVKGLKKMGASFARMYRGNFLDRCVCVVRDCMGWSNLLGYPVFASNGTKTDMCFKRRRSEEHTKAVLKHANMCVRFFRNEERKNEKNFGRLISPSMATSYESLFEFEFTSDNLALERSKDAWVSLLASFLGVRLDESTILQILTKHQNSRKAPGSHENVIHNIDDIMKLRSSLSEYLRVPSSGQ